MVLGLIVCVEGVVRGVVVFVFVRVKIHKREHTDILNKFGTLFVDVRM